MGQECRGSSFNGTIKANPSFFILFIYLFVLMAAWGCGLALLLPARKRIHTSLSFKCGISYSTLLERRRRRRRRRKKPAFEWCLGETRPIHKAREREFLYLWFDLKGELTK